MSVSISDFGALGDGKTICTSAIQQAIDATAAGGGGTVVVPPGVFVSGTINLRSNITLEVVAGATLLGSPNIDDYPAVNTRDGDRHCHHFIVAQDAHNVTICGTGTIDGNGPAFWKPQEGPRTWIGAKSPRISPMFDLVRCTDLRILDVTIANSPGWTVHPHMCQRVWIRGIKLLNHMFGPNTDGIDVNGCRDVMISDCYIECGDDAIVLKTTYDSQALERVTVTNCVIRTNCVGLKLGANESVHDMRQITFSNCVVYASTRAVGLYNWRGCTQEDIAISNIVCDTNCGMRLNRPIHIDVRQVENAPGVLRNVQISNFVARTDGRILITAADGYRLENVLLRDVRLSYPVIDDPDPIGRDAKSMQFSNHSPEARIARAAVVADGVTNLCVENLQIDWPQGPPPTDWLGLKMENGSDRVAEMASAKPPFSVLWGRRLRGGRINCPIATPTNGAAKYDLAESDAKVVE